jgi:Fur family transcriptional regulator, ferric uptake regulator
VRDTRQARTIREILEQHGEPVTAPEVHSYAMALVPGIGIATVYRHLHHLTVAGEIARVELPGQPCRFERAGKPHHHHFVCQGCQRVFDLMGCLGDLRSLVPDGFEVIKHDLTVYGHCRRCAAENAGTRVGV